MSLVCAVKNEENIDILRNTVKGRQSTLTTTTTTKKTTITTSRVTPQKCEPRVIEEFDYDESVPRSLMPDGKNALSKEAIYKSKLKHGIFYSPNRPSKGVSSAKYASGVAAVLAERNPVEIKAYQRNEVDPVALQTATYLTNKFRTTKDTNKLIKQGSWHTDQDDRLRMYAWKSSRRAVDLPQKEDEDYYDVEGMLLKNRMNYSKVLSSAEDRAGDRIEERYTTVPKVSPAVKRSYSMNAANSVFRTQNYESKHDLDLQRQKVEIAKLMASEKVMKQARARAAYELNKIAIEDPDEMIFGNMDYNRHAVVVAQRHLSKERTAEEKFKIQHQDELYMGKGLWVKNKEIDNTARTFVRPILTEVDARVEEQRETDRVLYERHSKQVRDWEDWRALQNLRVSNDGRLINSSRRKNTRMLNTREKVAVRKYNEMVASKERELQLKTDELNALIEERRTLEDTLDSNLQMYEKKQSQEFEEWMKITENDIFAIREEEEAVLTPYRNDVKTAEQDGINLKQEQTEIENDIKALEGEQMSIANEKELESLQKKLMVVQRKVELNENERELKREKLNLLESFRKEHKPNSLEEEAELKNSLGLSMGSTGYLQDLKKDEHLRPALMSDGATPGASARSVTGVSGVMEPDPAVANISPVTPHSTPRNAVNLKEKPISNVDTVVEDGITESTPSFSGFSESSKKEGFFKEVF
ncbi:hypothetical protein KAFR_0I01600 [Kazachstania africana CBS 2517]|uniref:Uncharacterized protein n=1 Tax=Kazachstania africana (strain ATCC 22294 / BCRC 22015 / CBS 2517 / CECT 1963 / NBRC 1671 / NRRL Y-8276) TaxID=1071382 RepID=H2AZZ1_KAZAF|nr:hypothetical protein KAFR_0I01600 [Kazachstania africana CBS 2517]CCF59941.1 hypothetical protein KAFR_0I01600 [Kazachstania africana CBS 2517]